MMINQKQSMLLSQELKDRQYFENSWNDKAFTDITYNQNIQWTNGPDYQQWVKDSTSAYGVNLSETLQV